MRIYLVGGSSKEEISHLLRVAKDFVHFAKEDIQIFPVLDTKPANGLEDQFAAYLECSEAPKNIESVRQFLTGVRIGWRGALDALVQQALAL